MSVFKEGYMIVSMIKNKSEHIYSDASDYGVPVRKGDHIWEAAKQLVEWYGLEGTRYEDKYHTGRSVRHDIELMDEWNSGRIERYRVYFTSCNMGKCIGHDGYISINELI